MKEERKKRKNNGEISGGKSQKNGPLAERKKTKTEIATGLGRKKETEDNYMKWESIVLKWESSDSYEVLDTHLLATQQEPYKNLSLNE